MNRATTYLLRTYFKMLRNYAKQQNTTMLSYINETLHGMLIMLFHTNAITLKQYYQIEGLKTSYAVLHKYDKTTVKSFTDMA